jgi:hypothetical protein
MAHKSTRTGDVLDQGVTVTPVAAGPGSFVEVRLTFGCCSLTQVLGTTGSSVFLRTTVELVAECHRCDRAL